MNMFTPVKVNVVNCLVSVAEASQHHIVNLVPLSEIVIVRTSVSFEKEGEQKIRGVVEAAVFRRIS